MDFYEMNSTPAEKLISQAEGMIDTCKTMIASARKDCHAGDTVLGNARAIVAEAKKLSDDSILGSVELSGPQDWPDILAAMESVVSALG